MQEILSKIANLESTLTGSLLGDMDTRTEIHQLKKQLQSFEPQGEVCTMDEGCISCGS